MNELKKEVMKQIMLEFCKENHTSPEVLIDGLRKAAEDLKAEK